MVIVRDRVYEHDRHLLRRWRGYSDYCDAFPDISKVVSDRSGSQRQRKTVESNGFHNDIPNLPSAITSSFPHDLTFSSWCCSYHSCVGGDP
jgi:hypothetical protein